MAGALAACDIGVDEHAGPLFMDQFLGYLRAGKLSAAYENTTVAYRQKMDAPAFATLVQRYALDRLVSSAWPNRSITFVSFFGRSSADIALHGRLVTQAGTFATRVRIVKRDARLELNDISLEIPNA
jgi:hypothetical protein